MRIMGALIPLWLLLSAHPVVASMRRLTLTWTENNSVALSKAIILCAICSFSAFTAPSARAMSNDDVKTPEQVAELYIGAWVKFDDASGNELSKYLHEPEVRSENEIFIIEDRHRNIDYNNAARAMYPSVRDPAKQRGLAAIIQATTEAPRRSECRALSHTSQPNQYIDGQTIYTVNFTCKVVAPPASLSNITVASVAEMSPEKLLAMAKIIQDEPASREVNVAVDLYTLGTSKPLFTGYAGFEENVINKLIMQ